VIDALVKQQVRFLAIKEGIRLEGRQDLQSKIMVTLFIWTQYRIMLATDVADVSHAFRVV
jgi:hypothetical protein